MCQNVFYIPTKIIQVCCKCNLTDRKFLKHWIVLFLFTFLIALPVICYQYRFTVYSLMWKYNKSEARKMMRHENDKRLKFANVFLEKFERKTTAAAEIKRKFDVGISVIAVSRNRHWFDHYKPRYLTQVVAYLHHFLKNSPNLKLKYQIFLCNVDDEPITFDEAKNLSRILPSFNRFTNISVLHRRTLNKTLEKEKEDYVYCAEQTLLQNVSYVFLIEDDALPHKDLFTVMDYLLTEHKDKMNTTYIKFYHPDRLLGFISLELERIPELVGLSLMMAALLVSLYRKLCPVSSINHYVLWTASLIYFVLVFLAVGRQNLIEFRRISKYLYQLTPAPSCCTPANLYPRHGMEQIIAYLKGVTCFSRFGKDTAIDNFRKYSKLPASMVQPNLFTHIGMYSSLRDSILNPFIV